MKDAITIIEYSKRKTVSAEDIWSAMSTKMYSNNPDSGSNKNKTTKLLFPKIPFQRLVREVGQNFRTDLRFSEDSMLIIQSAAEHHLIQLYNKANNAASHTGRKRLSIKDIQFIRRI